MQINPSEFELLKERNFGIGIYGSDFHVSAVIFNNNRIYIFDSLDKGEDSHQTEKGQFAIDRNCLLNDSKKEELA